MMDIILAIDLKYIIGIKLGYSHPNLDHRYQNRISAPRFIYRYHNEQVAPHKRQNGLSALQSN